MFLGLPNIQEEKPSFFNFENNWLPTARGRKLINKLEKFEFFHVGKNNSHPRKNEKNRENGLNFVINFLHFSCVFLDS